MLAVMECPLVMAPCPERAVAPLRRPACCQRRGSSAQRVGRRDDERIDGRFDDQPRCYTKGPRGTAGRQSQRRSSLGARRSSGAQGRGRCGAGGGMWRGRGGALVGGEASGLAAAACGRHRAAHPSSRSMRLAGSRRPVRSELAPSWGMLTR